MSMFISVSKNKIPFFSVIITTYNRANLLQRALNSLINQTFSDWECIIVDDGSTDDTYQIIKPLIITNPKFRYIYHSNRKQALSKNAGLLASSGIYSTFLDSDDEYLETHLETRFSILNQNPYVELLHGGIKIIGEEHVPDMNDLNQRIHLSQCIVGGTFFILNSKARELRGFDFEEYGDDTVFFKKALKSGLTIAKTDLPTYIYYRNTIDSICNNIRSYEY